MPEVVYSELMKQLKAAALAGGRIERDQKEQWNAYIREHGIPEAACRVHAKALSDPLKAVIISTGGDWDGYYVYSPSDEVAMKLVLD
jgi:hypothetical protein